MRRVILKIIISILGIVIFIIAGVVWYMFPSANKVLAYIEHNPQSSSFYLRVNDESVVTLNPNKLTPLASVVKIIIAIEYAEQAAAGDLDPDTLVSLSELDKFYLPNTDGGAHAAFLKNYANQITGGEISLRRVAKGMIAFSSNANTEYMQQLLGSDRINQRLQKLGVEKHSEIYHLVSSLFVADEMVADSGNKNSIPKRMRLLSDADYLGYIKRAQDKLVRDPTHKNSLTNFQVPIQKVWSERLPASTAAEYVSIARKMNSRDYFSPQSQGFLNELMESVMENPASREWLIHSGQKGGSTGTLLTKVLYATLKDGNSIELAYFMDDLKTYQMLQLSESLQAFELKILTNQNFRAEVLKRIGKLK